MSIKGIDSWSVIERVYLALQDEARGGAARRLVTHADVETAVRSLKKDFEGSLLGDTVADLSDVRLSPEEVARLLRPAFKGKDISEKWPASLKAARVSARPVKGDKGVFQFVDYVPGTDDPFPRSGRSEKPAVIERIFDQLTDSKTGQLTRNVVTNDDVIEAIRWGRDRLGLELSSANPANFIKDVIRGKGASGMWPQRLKDKHITARQLTGDKKVFEFIPYEEGQDEPFPDRFFYHEGVVRHRIQSVSLPLASKALGRDDETYLIQVAVKLTVVETHFALMSKLNVQELNHLQIGIKLRLAELDSLFSATYLDPDDQRLKSLLITAEAKKRDQRILEDQIIRQVHAVFSATDTDLVVPLVMTPVDDGIYIVEFHPVRREDFAAFDRLTLASEALYELVPRVKGI